MARARATTAGNWSASPNRSGVVEGLDVGVRRGPLHPDGGPARPDGQDDLQLLRGFRLTWSGLLPGTVGNVGSRRTLRVGVRFLGGFHVFRLVRSVSVGKLPATIGGHIIRRSSEEEFLGAHHVRGVDFRSGFVGHGFTSIRFLVARRVSLCPALDLTEGLGLPIEVALHGGNSAEYGGLRQLGEVEIPNFLLEPLHQAEARSGSGVHFGDEPRPVRVGTEQFGRGEDGRRSRRRSSWRRGRGWCLPASGSSAGVLASRCARPATSSWRFPFGQSWLFISLLVSGVFACAGQPASVRPTSRATASGVT